MTKKKILITVGAIVVVGFVILAITKLTKGTRQQKQQTNFIGGPAIGGTNEGQGQKNGQDLSFLPACLSGKELFSTFPLKASDYTSITPLGNLNPTGHTFPTDHLYVQVTGLEKYNYLGNPDNRKALLSPADMYITKIGKSEEIGGVADYGVDFAQCKDALGKFGHIGSLTTTIQNELAKIETKCQEYATGGENYKNCEYNNLKIEVKAGEEIGGAGDGRSGFLDYYPTTQKDTFYSLLQGPNGGKRTKEPRCGTVEVDIAGTAQGVWFYNLQGQVQQEDEHLALAFDNIETDKQVFSVGTAGTHGGIESGAYHFTPKTDGQIDRDFSQVTPDGKVYCYNTQSYNGGQGGAKKAILLTMPSAGKLRLAKASTFVCGAGPRQMPTSVVEYER